MSALNHATADQAGVPGQPNPQPPWTPVAPHDWPSNSDFVVLTGDAPWWMPGFLEKYIPTADTDRIDDAAGVCRHAAAAIRDLVADLHFRLQGLVSNNSSDDVNELEQFWQRAAGHQSVLTELSEAIDDVTTGLVGLRVWNDGPQEKIRDKIKSIVEGLGVVGVILAIGSILTDGGLDAIIVAVVEALDFFGIDAAGALAIPIANVVAAAETILVAAGGAIAITQGVVPAMQAAMSSTPNPDVEGVDTAKVSGDLSGHTQPSLAPDPDATPAGHPASISSRDNAETVRSLTRENESATTLRQAGYDMYQRPGRLPNGRNPDFQIEGKIFDNYAPSGSRARNIAGEIQDKVDNGQTERVVLNLKDSAVDLNAMRAQLHDWPIEGLKEVIAIDKQGTSSTSSPDTSGKRTASMALDYHLEIATPLSLVQVARELLEVARSLRSLDASVTPERLVDDGAVSNLETWIKVSKRKPQPWAPVITDLGITPTVGVGFQLDKNDTIPEQEDDMVRLASGVLDRVAGDALLSGLEVIWLVRRDGDLTVNERDDIWPPHRLAALNQPYRRETHTYAEE